MTGRVRDVVPITSRIPNPRDPSIAPDGARYVFSDYCGSGLGLYVARVDGTTGDTCAAALAIDTGHTMVGADWGASGFIAAEVSEPAHGVLLIDDTTFSVASTRIAGGRNPAWGPATASFAIDCP